MTAGCERHSAKAHHDDRRQRQRHRGPLLTPIGAGPQAAGGAGHQQAAAVTRHRQAVAVDQVIAVGLRQAVAQGLNAGAAVCAALDHQRAAHRHAALVSHGRHKPGGVGVARMHRRRKAKG